MPELFLFTDTSIAELVKEFTDEDDFIDALRCQQGEPLCHWMNVLQTKLLSLSVIEGISFKQTALECVVWFISLFLEDSGFVLFVCQSQDHFSAKAQPQGSLSYALWT